MATSRKRFEAVAVLAGVAAATVIADARVKAESPLEFFRNQTARRAPSYTREPIPVEPRGRSGLFGFFELFEEPRVPRKAAPAAPRNFERVLCQRTCDGAKIALGILPKQGKYRDEEAMCAAAGEDSPTRLLVGKFTPSSGMTPLIEGRAALDMSTAPKPAPCAAGAEAGPFMIPIMQDATLRRGDIVAFPDGFKVFVGKGHPPFKESDFVDAGTSKRVTSDIRKSVRKLEVTAR